jgi:hypothetical protein
MRHPFTARSVWLLARSLATAVAITVVTTPVAASADSGRAMGPAKAAPAAGPIVPLATCSGAGCDNRDPDATGCSAGSRNASGPDAVVNTPWGIVELRFSPTCQTNWVRVRNYPGGTAGVRMIVRDVPRNKAVLFNASTTPGTHFGNMVFSPGSNCAIGTVAFIAPLSIPDATVSSSSC